MSEIFFFNEDISFKLIHAQKISSWIKEIIYSEGKTLAVLNYIFCSDDYLLKINIDYLQHEYYTDILTFNQSEADEPLEGDIYISIERVKENATSFKKSFKEELHRVMIHGALHLLGYEDKSNIQKELMRKKEEACLSLQKF
jgi:probable rRNA maturation factor